MAKNTFSEILDEAIDDAEPPKPLPVGHYVCAVQTPPKYDKSSKKGTKYVEFTLKPIQPMDDVDKEELKEQGGLADRTLRHTLYLTNASKYRLRKFIEDCGLEYKAGTPFGEGIAALAGCQVIAIVKHEPSQKGDLLYANVDDTEPV